MPQLVFTSKEQKDDHAQDAWCKNICSTRKTASSLPVAMLRITDHLLSFFSLIISIQHIFNIVFFPPRVSDVRFPLLCDSQVERHQKDKSLERGVINKSLRVCNRMFPSIQSWHKALWHTGCCTKTDRDHVGNFFTFYFFLPLNKGDVTSCENTKSRDSIVIFRCWDIYKEGSKRGMGRGKE